VLLGEGIFRFFLWGVAKKLYNVLGVFTICIITRIYK